MKVAVVGPTYPHRGGIAHYTSLLASRIRSRHEVRVYTFRRQYPQWLFPGRSQIDPSPTAIVHVDSRRWLIPWWPHSWWKVRQDWISWRPDVVVMQWWVPFMAPMTAWLAARARGNGSRVVLLCHNVMPHERSRLDAILVRMALKQADRLIVHSTLDQQRVQQMLPRCAVEVVPHPSYADFRSTRWTRQRARSALEVRGRVLLFFGLVRPYKGLLDLLDALPAVLAEIKVTLLVVGEIWGSAETYTKRIRDLGIESRVKFVDRYVSNEEVAMFFAAADLAVLPYREATGSGVLQLALGLGVPVVATRTGGMAESVSDGVTGLLVNPRDVDALSRAIVRFFREEQAASFRVAIERTQTQFGWDNIVDAALKQTTEQSPYASS